MEMVNTLYGSQVEKSKCCAYCRRKGKYLTVKQMKNKECLRQQCRHLDKKEDHPYWSQRAAEKARKKANKEIEELLF